MRVAVFGSWELHNGFDYPLKGDRGAFESACRQIGFQIALHGHRVLASSYEPTSAEYQAIQGALDAVKQKQAQGVVGELLRSRVSDGPFDKDIRLFPYNLAYSHAIADRADLAHLFSVQLGHRVMVIGGGRGSYNAGVAALIAGKRIVPVGAFGGAAEKLLGSLAGLQTALATKPADPVIHGQLRNPWSERLLGVVVTALEFDKFPKIMLVHGRGLDITLLDDFLINNLNLPKPVIMRDVFGRSTAIPSKLQQLTLAVDGAIIIATPDDYGAALLAPNGSQLSPNVISYRFRARQNVWLEAGIFWSSIGLDRMMILRKGDIEIPSDLVGIETYHYESTPLERSSEIAQYIQVIKEA